MTEEDAKSKWCPFARTVETGTEGQTGTRNRVANRDDEAVFSASLLGAQCIGSACMAWRASKAERDTLRNYHDAPSVQPKFGMGPRLFPDGWTYGYTDRDREGRRFDLLHRVPEDDLTNGYCGLAGSPQ